MIISILWSVSTRVVEKRELKLYLEHGETYLDGLSMSEMKVQNDVPMVEPARILNISSQVERAKQGVQEY